MEGFAALPDPAQAGDLRGLVERLRLLKIWAGDPSYETIKSRVNAAWTSAGRPAGELANRSTVGHCFQPGRRRLNADLVVAVVAALHSDPGYVVRWRQALRAVAGELEAVSQVRVQASLPRDVADFTGRRRELDRLRDAARAGGAVLISAIEGMAGVGKTQLAVHAGHQLLREGIFRRVLFVNLRGFHSDPAQPPADPRAVLEGFLRLLGMPGHEIPYGLDERAAAYRARLARSRTLVILDNVGTAEQVRALLPATPSCLTLITSRRALTELPAAMHLTVDVFVPDEATAFLIRSVPGVPVGTDPDAAARISLRCGYLPLALSLIAGHIRNTPGWTLTDHAYRLEERHHERRPDAGVELALALSYEDLPTEQQRLIRLAALHPGQDFDAYAAAALADTDLATAERQLDHLRRDHLLQQATPGRYAFHDLVRVHAVGRAHDQDRPPARRAALTRLFDHYLATAAGALNTLEPAVSRHRPRIPPVTTATPELTDPNEARAWLDTERPNLTAMAAYTATHGWPGHTTRLSHLLFRYLDHGDPADALTVHGHARRAARDSGDPSGLAHALNGLGTAHLRLGRHRLAANHLGQALDLFRQIDDPAGQACATHSLGTVLTRLGRHQEGLDHLRRALLMHRQAGDRINEASALNGLGGVMYRSGRFAEAAKYCRQASTVARQTGNRTSEAIALHGVAEAEMQMGRHGAAREHLQQVLSLYRQFGDRHAEAGALDSLGTLHTRLGHADQATEYHREALALFREIGDQDGEAWALNGLGEAAHAAGRDTDAVAHHTAACAIATESGARDQQDRAQAGLRHAYGTTDSQCHAIRKTNRSS